MAILTALLASALPKLLLDVGLGWAKSRTDASSVRIRAIAGAVSQVFSAEAERRKARSAERVEAMSFRIFWVPWTIATVPWALWFGIGVLDSIALLDGWNLTVHALPPQLLEHSKAISFALFGSGAVTGIGQLIARALKKN